MSKDNLDYLYDMDVKDFVNRKKSLIKPLYVNEEGIKVYSPQDREKLISLELQADALEQQDIYIPPGSIFPAETTIHHPAAELKHQTMNRFYREGNTYYVVFDNHAILTQNKATGPNMIKSYMVTKKDKKSKLEFVGIHNVKREKFINDFVDVLNPKAYFEVRKAIIDSNIKKDAMNGSGLEFDFE